MITRPIKHCIENVLTKTSYEGLKSYHSFLAMKLIIESVCFCVTVVSWAPLLHSECVMESRCRCLVSYTAMLLRKSVTDSGNVHRNLMLLCASMVGQCKQHEHRWYCHGWLSTNLNIIVMFTVCQNALQKANIDGKLLLKWHFLDVMTAGKRALLWFWVGTCVCQFMPVCESVLRCQSEQGTENIVTLCLSLLAIWGTDSCICLVIQYN